MHINFGPEYVDIRQHKNFSRQLDELHRRYNRMNEVHDALDWLLGRNPEAGEIINSEPYHRVYKTNPRGATPSFWVFYRYNPEERPQVELLSIRPVEAEEGL